MHIVDRPELAPGHCMLSLKSEDPLGFIDTMLTPPVVDPRVYASVSVVREWAGKLGMVDGGDLERALREIENLKVQLAEADADLNALSYLKGRGYQQVKRSGRPPAQKAA